MYRLYHHPLDPASRRVRLTLAEKDIACELILEKPWERRAEFVSLSPNGELPLLVIAESIGHTPIADATAICEFLEETYKSNSLLGKDSFMRAEVRRLVNWFDGKFAQDVTQNLVGEKALKRLQGTGQPDSNRIRTGYTHIHTHLDYLSYLTDNRSWLAGDTYSYADLAGASHLSVLDYLGDVPWSDYPLVKDWYARIKSRPAFRQILADHIAGLPPPRHYADLDF